MTLKKKKRNRNIAINDIKKYCDKCYLVTETKSEDWNIFFQDVN